MSVLEISRVDRVDRTYDLAALFPDLEGPFTAADVALLTKGTKPTVATVWTPVTVASSVATVKWAGPDAATTGAIAVAASCDAWMRASDGDETRTVKLGRITILGGGAPLAIPTGVPVVSVNGKTGSAIVLSASDVGAGTGTGADLADTGYDVVLLLGQSNMQGGDGLGPVSAVLDVTDPRVYSYGATGTYASQIAQASDPLAHRGGAGGVGPGMSFARWYAGTVPGNRRVLLVPAAYNGTAFGSGTLRWDPTTAWPNDSTNLYNLAITQAQAAVVAAGPNARIVAVLWIQGESDAAAGLAGATYRTYLEQLIDGLRSRLSLPNLPFVIGSMLPEYIASSSAAAAINTIHAATPNRKRYTAYVAGPTGMAKADVLHYTPAGIREMGRRLLAGLATAKTNTAPSGAVADAPPTPPSVLTVPGAPTIGTATAGVTSASVAFTAPASNGGAAITSYTVTASTGPTASGASSPITVSGLTAGTPVTFTVTATNSVGTGPASAASNSVTPTSGVTVPGQPTGVSATAGNAQATVTFTAPASNGGATITGYTATSTPGGLTGTITGATAAPITVTGLTNGTGYTFTVHATNSAGNSAESSASSSVTPTAGVTTYAADTFSRTAGTPGVTETGSFAWTSLVNGAGTATWATDGVTLNGSESSNAVDSILYIDDAHADGTLQVTLTDLTLNQAGLAFRVVDAANHLLLWAEASSYRLSSRAAGAFTTIVNAAAVVPVDGDILKVVLSGTSITVYKNGNATPIITTTSSLYSTATKHGVWTAGNPAVKKFGAFTHTSATT